MIIFALFVIFVLLLLSTFLLWKSTKRLLEFDDMFQRIIQPMSEYSETLSRITSAEGILHDHPEVVEFHRANVKLLAEINGSINSVKEILPKVKKSSLPSPESV